MTMKQASSGPLLVAKTLIGMFSTVRQSDPPSSAPNKKDHIRLITISGSHFCEKARWILDVLERDESNPYYYTEDGHPPGFHSYETLKVSNEQASTTPMVVVPSSENHTETVLWESSQIMSELLPNLYPTEIAAEVKAMEANLGKRLGPALRCHVYYHLFSDLDKYQSTAEALVADPSKMSRIEATLWGKFLPKGLAKGIWKSLGINEQASEASVKELRTVFQELSTRLQQNGNKYLMDTPKKSYGFTAADLTLAALAYPYVRPPEMEFWLAQKDTLPPAVKDLGDELRATRAGQHVLKLYKEHRPTNDNGVAVMKYADRNQTLWQWLFGS